jgi:hypothetical protein
MTGQIRDAAKAVADKNARIFGWFRNMQRAISDDAQKEKIEGHVLWASSLDALAQIYGARLGIPSRNNRQRFVTTLLDLGHPHPLHTVAVPLLHHDLIGLRPDPTAETLLGTEPLREYARAAGGPALARIWTRAEDVQGTGTIAALERSASKEVRKAIAANRYADLLYVEYRCGAVHGLDLGWKTFPAYRDREAGVEPAYTNYQYPGSERPGERQYRTRISFSLSYLCVVLSNVIDQLETLCSNAGHVIPPYATLEE